MCFDFQSDVLFGLLQQLNGEEDELKSEKEAVTANETDSSPTKQQHTPPVVGPTPTELESLNELIKFDHIYYKAPCVSKEAFPEACKIETGEVKDIQDHCHTGITSNSTQDTSSILLDNPDEQEIPELELEELPDNFQLLEELQDLFQQDLLPNTEVPETPATDIVPQKIQIQNTCESTKGRKRKHSVSSDSAYSSEPDIVDLTTEASSPFQPQDISDASSPFSDMSSSPLSDDLWVEDFTDLFPALI